MIQVDLLRLRISERKHIIIGADRRQDSVRDRKRRSFRPAGSKRGDFPIV
jgi:hypothetical protein